MKNLTECNTQIDQTREKLATVETELAELKQQIATVKDSNLRLAQSNIGKTRKPKGLQIQRQKLFDLQAQKAELKDVRDYLEDRLSQLQQDRKLAGHYQQVQLFHEHEARFSEKNEEIQETINGIADALTVLKQKIGKLKETGHPLVRLRTILGALEKENICLKSFIEHGKVAKSDHGNNGFLDEIVGRYRQAATSNGANALDAAQQIKTDYENIIEYALYPMK